MVTLLIEKDEHLYIIKARHAIVAAVKKNKLVITLFEPENPHEELMRLVSTNGKTMYHIEGYDSCHFC